MSIIEEKEFNLLFLGTKLGFLNPLKINTSMPNFSQDEFWRFILLIVNLVKIPLIPKSILAKKKLEKSFRKKYLARFFIFFFTFAMTTILTKHVVFIRLIMV